MPSQASRRDSFIRSFSPSSLSPLAPPLPPSSPHMTSARLSLTLFLSLVLALKAAELNRCCWGKKEKEQHNQTWRFWIFFLSYFYWMSLQEISFLQTMCSCGCSELNSLNFSCTVSINIRGKKIINQQCRLLQRSQPHTVSRSAKSTLTGSEDAPRPLLQQDEQSLTFLVLHISNSVKPLLLHLSRPTLIK